VLFNDVIDMIIEDVLYKDKIILIYDVDNDEINNCFMMLNNKEVNIVYDDV